MRRKEITIETPEKISFTYTISDIGTRIAAYTIDTIIQGLIILVFVLLLIIIGAPTGNLIGYDSYFNIAMAFYLLLVFFFKWFYFVFFEVKMEGQSPGKKAMRIRVIKDNGDRLDFETIILRNFLRAVDGFPVFPLTGGFVAMIDKKSRRLGDMVANTLVVNESRFDLNEPDFNIRFSFTHHDNYKNVANRLNEYDLYVIRRFLKESYKLPAEKKREVSYNLANKVKKKLKIDQTIREPIKFLESIYKSHEV